MSSKVVLVYAKRFWDIGKKPIDGVGLYAKMWFDTVSNVFHDNEIVYVDYSEAYKLRGIRDVTRLFSISNSIESFRSAIKPHQTNLIAVNEHAFARRKIREFAHSSGIPRKFLEPHDGIRSNLRETDGVNNVIALGSWNSYKSYELLGYKPQNVYAIGWKYWDNYLNTYESQGRTRILMFLGSICVRKGVYFIEEIVNLLVGKYPDFSLNLVGFVNNKDLEIWLTSLQSRFPLHFEWTNKRIMYGEGDWLKMRKNTAFALFPSWEEGLAGCALDVINLGIPVIHSDRTGLEAAHDFIADLDFFHDGWVDKIAKLISLGQSTWVEIHQNQKRVAFYQDLENDQLSRVLGRLKSGGLWPKVDIDCQIITPEDEKRFDMNFKTSCTDAEFIVRRAISRDSFDSQIMLELKNRNKTQFSPQDRIRASILILDKHSRFKEVVTKMVGTTQDSEIVTSWNPSSLSSSSSSGNTGNQVKLTMVAYHHSFRSETLEVEVVKYWQLFLDSLYTIFVYQPKRIWLRVIWKLRKEFNYLG